MNWWKSCLFIACCVSWIFAHGKSVDEERGMRIREIAQRMDEVWDRQGMQDCEIEKDRIKIITDEIEDFLNDRETFDLELAEWKHVGIIASKDGKIKVYTWGKENCDGIWIWGGVVQTAQGEVYPLKVGEKRLKSIGENKIVEEDEWYGAMYYKIVDVKRKKGKDYYILLGWAGREKSVQYKVIETLSIKGHDLRFGAEKILEGENGKERTGRKIFGYGARYSMTLNYDEKEKRIVYDHLVPQRNTLKGVESLYGPDFSYDGYAYQKKKWVRQENIDVRNEE